MLLNFKIMNKIDYYFSKKKKKCSSFYIIYVVFLFHFLFVFPYILF
jgi:hypothetical protein